MKKLMLFFFMVMNVNAGVLIEPILGYSRSSTDSSSINNHSGVVYGGRVAYKLPFFAFLGVQYNQGVFREEDEALNRKVSNFGLVLGTGIVPLLRFWGKYGLSSEYSVDGGSTSYTGSSFGVGAGFSILPLISLNLEYNFIQYDKNENGVRLVTPIDVKELLLSVSVPFSL